MAVHAKLSAFLALWGLWASTDVPAATPDYQKEVAPVLEQYCFSCHGGGRKKGGIALDRHASEKERLEDRELWKAVAQNVHSRNMPPEGKPQPSETERQVIAQYVQETVFQVDCSRPDPGRVTIRRLNRIEYNNTIRDLLGVEGNYSADFAADDLGYGFDNIGDVLSLSPVLMERYLNAGERAVTEAFAKASNATQRLFWHRFVIMSQPPETDMSVARQAISQFGERAFRRTITTREAERYVELFTSVRSGGQNYIDALQVVFQAMLVSPHFLFRLEESTDPAESERVVPVSEYALASRLSYFLWSTMPDEKLFARAKKGELRKDMEHEVPRMLGDSKSRALVENFAGQWLQLRNLAESTPDRKIFPGFDEDLRAAMRRETELCFETLMREDRSVLELLGANYTFLNERLARHYGIKGVKGQEFRRVELKDKRRGGVLTHGSMLTLTSNPTRTSPVKRGKWVLETLLGAPPPPPPPNVPELAESGAKLSGTLRERMEQHRANPACASCHTRMDAIGFGLENYDGIGSWRYDEGEFEINPAGELGPGAKFRGPAELRETLLRDHRQEYLRCLTEKMLTYALGRGLEHYDRCAVEGILKGLEAGEPKFSRLVLGVVNSAPFQYRRQATP